MMIVRTALIAATILFGAAACSVETTEPEPDPAPASVTTDLTAPRRLEGPGKCESYCDDKYCYICREYNGMCGCIIGD
jgi:hypothetical protein